MLLVTSEFVNSAQIERSINIIKNALNKVKENLIRATSAKIIADVITKIIRWNQTEVRKIRIVAKIKLRKESNYIATFTNKFPIKLTNIKFLYKWNPKFSDQ